MTTSPDSGGGKLPRLHLVTDQATVARDSFRATVSKLCHEAGSAIALHLRAHGLAGREVWEIADFCRECLARSGGTMIVNDRLDIALACSADGVQLGSRSFSPGEARSLLDSRVLVGRSVHSLDEAVLARGEGADFLLAGMVFESGSHPGRPGWGIDRLREIARAGPPVIAIGGVQPHHVAAILTSGASGVAVVSGVWMAPDPIQALRMYLSELE